MKRWRVPVRIYNLHHAHNVEAGCRSTRDASKRFPMHPNLRHVLLTLILVMCRNVNFTTGNSNAAEGFPFCRGPDLGHSAKTIFAEGRPSATRDPRQRLLRRGPDPRQRNALGQGPSLPRAGPSAKKGRSAVWAQSNGGSGR